MSVAGTSAAARLARIADAVRQHEPRLEERDEPFWEAAVALILRISAEDRLEVLFIKRATRENDPWSGQIALPGGRFDAADASLEATAIRETREEVQLDLLAHGTILGALNEIRPRTPVLPPVIVRPFVAVVSADAPVGGSDEVAAAFWVPLDQLFDPASARETEITVRGFTMRRPAIHFGEHFIWGMTEIILRSFEPIAA
jgi:8-oxo-dGTP pyrophosphatase MutT (NUDIX family)